MRDRLELFHALVEPHEAGYRAFSTDFPRIFGFGDSPEAARNSLGRVILEVYAFHRIAPETYTPPRS